MMQTNDDPVRQQAIARFNDIAGRAGESVGRPPAAFQFRRGRIFYAPNRGVAEIANAIVLSGEWFVLSGDLILCDAFHQTPFPPFSAYHMGVVPPNRLDLIHPPPIALDIPRAFLLGGCPNYSHWLMDHLPLVSLWRGDCPLLVNGKLRPFQIDSLAAVGVSADRLVELDYPNAYALPNVLFPTLNSFFAGMPPQQFQPNIVPWLRSKLGYLFAPGPARRRIFISRAAAGSAAGRRLLNDEEIVDVARRHGFEIVASETLPFAEQVKLFSDASVIIGPHGAGLTNSVFAPAGARVVELIGPRGSAPATERAAIRLLAGEMNLEFHRVVGQSDVNRGIEHDHLVNEQFTIDPRVFAALLDRL